jgi:DNA-binding GntR family transcriptional regulator
MDRPTRREPTYRSLVSAIRTSIRDGSLGPERRLPTEQELAAQYGVSRGTVRRAYLELVNDGTVVRFPGKGSFVSQEQPYQRLFGSIDELLGIAVDTMLEVIEPLHSTNDSDAATALGLQFDDVLKVAYRRLHGDTPFCYSDVFLPPRLFRHLQQFAFLHERMARSEETILSILDRVLPQPITGARQTVTAVALNAGIACHIGCDAGDPAMRIERVHFDADGRPVDRCVNYFNPNRYVYRMQLQRNQLRVRQDAVTEEN